MTDNLGHKAVATARQAELAICKALARRRHFPEAWEEELLDLLHKFVLEGVAEGESDE